MTLNATTQTRKGDWIMTFTGVHYWPLDPRPEEVSVVDIAHHLSMMPRYHGATKHPYSVAQHSVLMAGHLLERQDNKKLALIALFHDAAEAYLHDLPRPVKNFIHGYEELEQLNLRAIAAYIGVDSLEKPALVHELDLRICVDESQALMHAPEAFRMLGPALGVPIERWTPEYAESRFFRLALQFASDLAGMQVLR